MANSHQAQRRADARQQTRAQRRLAEREARKTPAPQRRFPLVETLGAIVTLAVIAVIVVVAFLRAGSAVPSRTASAGPPVTTPGAYRPAPSMLKVGTTAPDFTLHDAQGNSHSLADQRGHPVVLEFFAVWCPHCQREAPIINALANQYRAKGVRVWSILANPYGPNYDRSFGQDTTPASASDLEWFAKNFHEHVPQLIDPSFHVVNTYGVSSYPGIYVVDGRGKIVHASAGEQPESALSDAINSALRTS